MARQPSTPDSLPQTPVTSDKPAGKPPGRKAKQAQRPSDAVITMALKRLVIERHADSRGAAAGQ